MMARLGIKRANGDIEYAELTTNKSLVGSHYLTVERYGTPYYAKLGDSVSTHLCVEGSDGQKRYVQKEIFTWKYVVGGSHKIKDLVIPETGKYKLIINHAHKSVDGALLDDYDDIQIHKFSKYSSVTNYKITAMDGTIISVYKNEPGVPKNGKPTYWDTILKSIEYVGD